MTVAQQRRFYFPLWNKAASAQDWVMVKSRLLAAAPVSWGLSEADQLIARIWDAAGHLARNEHRGITATDLRHACHVVALGADKSSEKMTSKETDRVADLFRLLAQPDSIDLMRAWLDPQIGQRKRLVLSIKRYAQQITGNDFKSEAYILSIAEPKFPGRFTSPFWEDLDLSSLQKLAITLSERSRSKVGPRCPQRAVPT